MTVATSAEGAVASHHPPRLPFVLSVGVTGHRREALPAEACEGLEERIRGALTLLVEGAAAVLAQEAQFYTAEPMRLLFVSPLADGADQIAARIAFDLGFELHVVLPFPSATYRRELAGQKARTTFDDLIAKASCVLELPVSTSGRSTLM